MTLRIGLIGAGRIGHVHAASIAGHPDAELALVADPVPGAAEALAGRFGAEATTDLDRVFDPARVDAVLIGSPTPFHVEQILRAADAGLAALVEKPVDLDLARVDDCIARVGDAGARIMVGFNRRFDPGVVELRARIGEGGAGEIGPVEQLTILSRDPAPPPAAYLERSGGLFRDMTIHDLDMARFLLGEIVEVAAVTQTTDPAIAELGDVDGAVVTLRAASGAIATIVNSRHSAAGYDQRLEAFGPRGVLSTGNHTATSVRFAGAGVTDAAGPWLDFFLERYAAAYRAELDAFVTGLASGGALPTSLADGRAALLLADAAEQAARTGQRVDVSGRPG